MRLFKKKPPQEIQPIVKQECKHKWQDFNWYLKEEYHQLPTGPIRYSWKIMEPYVCCWCHKRKDVILYQESGEVSNFKNYNKRLEMFKLHCGNNLKPTPYVEDKVSDMIHSIDRTYLNIVAKLYPERLGLTKEEIEVIKNG